MAIFTIVLAHQGKAPALPVTKQESQERLYVLQVNGATIRCHVAASTKADRFSAEKWSDGQSNLTRPMERQQKTVMDSSPVASNEMN